MEYQSRREGLQDPYLVNRHTDGPMVCDSTRSQSHHDTNAIAGQVLHMGRHF